MEGPGPRRRVTFKIVGRDHGIVRVTVDGIDANFLIKLGFLQDLISGRIVEAYALEASDSDAWRSRSRSNPSRQEGHLRLNP